MWRDCVLSKPFLAKTTHQRPALLLFYMFHICKSFAGESGICCSARAAGSTRKATRPDEGLRMRCGSEDCVRAKKQVFARPDVPMALAKIYAVTENRDQIPELEQALARDQFHIFAGFEGVQLRWHTHTHTHARTQTAYETWEYRQYRV